MQGWKKRFYIGQANSGQFFEYVRKVRTHRHTVCSYCTISMQSMLILGDLGHVSQENLNKKML